MERYAAKRALLRPVVADERGEPERPGGYRVEHQTGAAAVVLAHLPTAVAHSAELDRFAIPLQTAGQTAGRVVLIEECTGRVVARRALSLPVRSCHRTPASHPRPALRRLGEAAPPLAPNGVRHRGGA